MKSSEIMDAIEEIAANPSKLTKEKLVKQYIADEDFLAVVKAAYDPFKRYNIATKTLDNLPPVAVTLEVSDFQASDWLVLEQLASGALSGDNAAFAISSVMSQLNYKSSTLFRRILLKDLRAGFGESTINKARAGTIPDFPYMRCSLPPKSDMPKWDWSKGIISQEKADGMFANVTRRGHNTVEILSRQGSPFSSAILCDLAEEVKRVLKVDTQSHGELLVIDRATNAVLPREVGNGVLNSILSGGSLDPAYEVRFYAWDQIPLAEVKSKGKYQVGYVARLKSLLLQVGHPKPNSLIRVVPTKIVKSKDEAFAHYRDFLSKGKEGTVLKSPGAIWRDGTSKEQVKLKLEVVVDLVVDGFNEGTGKFAGQLGSLQCSSSCGLLKVDVSGRGDAMRAEVWENRVDWLDSIVSVKANAIMVPNETNGIERHSLFLPIFIERRTDKLVADSLQSIQDQFKAAIT